MSKKVANAFMRAGNEMIQGFVSAFVPMSTFETRLNLGLRRKHMEATITSIAIILFFGFVLVVALYLTATYG